MLGHNFFIYQDAETNRKQTLFIVVKMENMVWLKQINKILGGLGKATFLLKWCWFRDKKRS